MIEYEMVLLESRKETENKLRWDAQLTNAGTMALDPTENERNKRHLDGYTRIFPDGRRKVFTYRPPYTTRARQGGRPSAGLGS